VLLAKANGDCENNRWYHWYVTNSKAYKTQSLFIKIPFTLCYSGCSKVVLAQFLTIKRSLKIIYNKLLNYNFQRTQHIMLKDETVSMTMKILLNNFGRRKVVYYSVILTSFVLIVQWQFYSSSQTKLTADATENNIQSLGTSNRLILGGDDNSTSFLISNETCILATTNMMPSPTLPTVDVSTSVPILIEPQPELYQMIERFSGEDKLLRMNTNFKRILFWNKVIVGPNRPQ
jgi:hypothetical protein